MKKTITHRRREFIQPSFPNNRLSSRPGKKRVEKREWIEEDSQIYSRLPDTAISTPYDLPNPTDNAPSFSQTMNYSETGGYTPPGFSDEFSPDYVGMVPGMIPGLGNSNFDPSPVALMLDVGHGFSWVAVPDQGYTETGGVQEFFLVSGLDYPSMYTGGYNVNVTIYDISGNVAYMKTEVDGLFSGLVDFLTMIWDGLCGVMEAAAGVVGAAMSWLVEMILSIVNGIIDEITTPIKSAFSSIVNAFLDCFNSPVNVDKIVDLLFNSNFAQLTIALISALLIINTLLAPITFSVGSLLTIIISIVISAIFTLTPVGEMIITADYRPIVEGFIHAVGLASEYSALIIVEIIKGIALMEVIKHRARIPFRNQVIGVAFGIYGIASVLYYLTTWHMLDEDTKIKSSSFMIAGNFAALYWYLFGFGPLQSIWKTAYSTVYYILIAISTISLIMSAGLLATMFIYP